jgi:hypothetical protein
MVNVEAAADDGAVNLKGDRTVRIEDVLQALNR